MRGAIGIDIHKATLVVASDQGAPWTVPNTPAGIGRLVDRVRGLQPTVIVLEPSGGYERPLLAALHAAQLPVARVPPRAVRHFAKASRISAKADGLDARVLAASGTVMTPPLTPVPSPVAIQLAELTGRRRQLTETAADQRRRDTAGPQARASIDRQLAFLADEVTALTAQIAALVDADPVLRHRRTLLCSMPGIGPTTAHLLLAELSELGTLAPKALAALVGVAPITHQSGASAGTARIDGGRRHVRTGLWMPTLTAMRFNPVIRAVRDRLTAAHKPHKLVTIACMRKVLIILNAMLAKDEPWCPPQLVA